MGEYRVVYGGITHRVRAADAYDAAFKVAAVRTDLLLAETALVKRASLPEETQPMKIQLR